MQSRKFDYFNTRCEYFLAEARTASAFGKGTQLTDVYQGIATAIIKTKGEWTNTPQQVSDDARFLAKKYIVTLSNQYFGYMTPQFTLSLIQEYFETKGYDVEFPQEFIDADNATTEELALYFIEYYKPSVLASLKKDKSGNPIIPKRNNRRDLVDYMISEIPLIHDLSDASDIRKGLQIRRLLESYYSSKEDPRSIGYRLIAPALLKQSALASKDNINLLINVFMSTNIIGGVRCDITSPEFVEYLRSRAIVDVNGEEMASDDLEMFVNNRGDNYTGNRYAGADKDRTAWTTLPVEERDRISKLLAPYIREARKESYKRLKEKRAHYNATTKKVKEDPEEVQEFVSSCLDALKSDIAQIYKNIYGGKPTHTGLSNSTRSVTDYSGLYNNLSSFLKVNVNAPKIIEDLRERYAPKHSTRENKKSDSTEFVSFDRITSELDNLNQQLNNPVGCVIPNILNDMIKTYLKNNDMASSYVDIDNVEAEQKGYYDGFDDQVLLQIIPNDLKEDFRMWNDMYKNDGKRKFYNMLNKIRNNVGTSDIYADMEDNSADAAERIRQRNFTPSKSAIGPQETHVENPEEDEENEKSVMSYMTEQVVRDSLSNPRGNFVDRGFKKPENYNRWMQING